MRHVFHKIALFLHLLEIDIQLLKVAFTILFYRWDILFLQFGCGAQFISLWCTALQQLYFLIMCVDEEVLSNNRLLEKLNKYSYIVFHHILFPLTTIITVNFWVLYLINPRLIEGFGVLENIVFRASIDNHLLTFMLSLGELTLIEKKPMKPKITFYAMLSIGTVYLIVIYIFYLISGHWAYPVLGKVPLWLHIVTIWINAMLGSMVTWAGWKIREYTISKISKEIITLKLE